MPRLFVVKRDKTREEFQREKVLNGMAIAAGKRPVSAEALRLAAERVERDLFQEFEDEVSSEEVGERVMAELEKLDTVAYIRFASVYRKFDTVEDFKRIVSHMDCAEPRGVIEPCAGLEEQALKN